VAEELASFIDGFLSWISTKHGVRAPSWRYSVETGLRYRFRAFIAARYIPPTETIIVNHTLKYYYRVNRTLTEQT